MTSDLEEFLASLQDPAPPTDLPDVLVALWHDAKGDWDAAHHVAQDIDTADAAWVHAYLHRKEGDLGNAGYWYRRARRPVATDSLDDEWRRIATALLAERP
jgi:hypothetical protein